MTSCFHTDVWPSPFVHGLRTVRLTLKATHLVGKMYVSPQPAAMTLLRSCLGALSSAWEQGQGHAKTIDLKLFSKEHTKMIISWPHRHFNQNQPSLIIGILKIFTRLGSNWLWLLKYLASLGIFRRRNCYRPWRHFQK